MALQLRCTFYEEDHLSTLAPKNDGLRKKIWELKKAHYSEVSLTAVCPSHWLARLSAQAATFKNKKVLTIPNPIDTTVYRPLIPNKRTKFGISEEKTIALFGSFNVLGDDRKGFKELIAALEILRKSHPALNERLEIAVIGREDAEMAESLPYPVHFLGFHNNDKALVECYSVADFFVIPSKQDNLPNMCLEAVACGLPVIGFDIGGVPDMVVDCKNGYLVPSFDASAMAMAIYKMATEADRAGFSTYGRNKVLTEFSEQIVAGKMIELYKKSLVKTTYK